MMARVTGDKRVSILISREMFMLKNRSDPNDEIL
jgi:hypothetical protein